MELTSLERDMLEGKHGEGVALAMKVQVGTGKAFYARRMVPITRAHVAASAQEGDLYFVTKLLDLGARCLVSPTTNPSMDLKYVEEHLWTLTDDGRARVEASNDAYRRIGATMTLSCTPEIEKNVPAFGEVVAFSESSAPRRTSTPCSGPAPTASRRSARLCAAVTGRVPEYGFLLDENRRAEVLVEVEGQGRGGLRLAPPGLRLPAGVQGRRGAGVHAASRSARRRRASCSSAPSWPRPARWPCTTSPASPPRRPTVEAALGGKAPKAHVTITQADLERVREQFAGEPGPIEYAMFGCPHLTIRQVGEIAAQIDGRRFAVDTWFLVSSLTLELADRMGYLDTIRRAGGHVLPDTCMDIPGGWDVYYDRPGVTESQKCAFYCQVYGQRYAVRPLPQAVEAAITGEVH